jgi:uncharacterized protein
MLIEFTVGNYKSFKEPTTFSMVAGKIVSKDKSLDENNVFEVNNKLSLLKSAAIYGANASGKSNFVKAFNFMQDFVVQSANQSQANDPIEVEQFKLHFEIENEPSHFEAVFILDGTQYRYGFEATPKRVISEWLYYVPTVREAELFTRDLKGIHIPRGSKFKEGRGIEARTRDNALFSSVVAQFNGDIATKIIEWFKSIIFISGLHDATSIVTANMLETEEYKDLVIEMLKNFDLGFDEISLTTIEAEIPEEMKPVFEALAKRFEKLGNQFESGKVQQTSIWTKHLKHGSSKPSYELFDLNENESAGTQKIFALAAPIVSALKEGRTFVIDELDARLHVILSRKIVQLFNSNETNRNKAQLIFTTHDTNLLDNKLFRRDQIWFTEKDKFSATKLYSLAEFQVRNDASFEKDYIQGRYGAIPYVGDLAKALGVITRS